MRSHAAGESARKTGGCNRCLVCRYDRTCRDSEVVWEAEGSVEVERGHIFAVGGENDGLRNVVVQPQNPSVQIQRYRVLFNEGDRAEFSALFDVPEEGLAEGKWYTPTGDVRNAPCEPQG